MSKLIIQIEDEDIDTVLEYLDQGEISHRCVQKNIDRLLSASSMALGALDSEPPRIRSFGEFDSYYECNSR